MSDRIKKKKENILRRAFDALIAIQKKDYDGALTYVCIAIEALSKLEYGDLKSSKRMKRFLREYQYFITRVAYGKLEVAGNMIFSCPSDKEHPHKSFEEVIYHVVRCGSVHECDIGEGVLITEDRVLGSDEQGRFLFSTHLIMALIMLVITSPHFYGFRILDKLEFTLKSESGHASIFHINSLFGKRDFVYGLFKQLSA